MIALKKVTDKLPRELRNNVNGYVQSIINDQEEIFKENGIEFSKELSEKFVFIIGIRRIIQFVDSQYWTMNNSFSILQTFDVKSVKIGSQSLNTQSQYYKELVDLRKTLYEFLGKNNLADLIANKSIGEILNLLKKEQ